MPQSGAQGKYPPGVSPTSCAEAAPPRDRDEAGRFLKTLDPAARDFTFQTFHDRKKEVPEDKTLARATSHRDEVLQLYARGSGVWLTVNETDLTGRKSENIKRVRAIWQEDDDGHGGPFPLEPSLVVESSPGKFHRYWFVADAWPADEQGRADFAAVMTRMVESYGCDKNAKDISRVLRLPGFLHRKDPTQPHMVRVVENSGRRYTHEELLRAFPPVQREKKQQRESRSSGYDELRIAEALNHVPADDRDIWLQVGMALKDELGDRGRSIWDAWSSHSDKFNAKDQEKTWRSFRRNGIGIGTLFHYAKQHGWAPSQRNTESGADESEIAKLAGLTHFEYDRMRSEVADRLGIRVSTLDDKVEALRKRRGKEASKNAAPSIDADKAKAAAGDLVTCPDILERFGAAITEAGLVGETNNAKILYLALTSRLFERPISVAVKGVSSGGKSFTVERALAFIPSVAYLAVTSGSEKSLFFLEESLSHRHLLLYEAAGLGHDKTGAEPNPFAYAIRTLLSEGRLKYAISLKAEDGTIKTAIIEKEGPTGLITTTTSAKLHPENETRILSLGVIDTPAQTKAVMYRLAMGKVDGTDYAPWHALQEWLATGERRVFVPYARTLADAIPPISVRLRRDFAALLSLIHAHALLHRESRERDDHGQIVATVADYAAVYNLVGKLFSEGIEATVPPIVRETVEAVGECLRRGGDNPKGMDGVATVSLTALGKELRLDKGAVHHRVGKAIKAGYLVNQQDRPGKPARLVLGDPLPEETDLLPPPSTVVCASDPESPSTLHHPCKKSSADKGLDTVEGCSTPPPPLRGVQHPLTPSADCRKSPPVEVLKADPGRRPPTTPSDYAAGADGDLDLPEGLRRGPDNRAPFQSAAGNGNAARVPNDINAVREENVARGDPPEGPADTCAQCNAAEPGPLDHVVAAEGVIRLHPGVIGPH